MAWCKLSSLNAAVSRTLRGRNYPLSREAILEIAEGKTVEGWELDYFLSKALRREEYPDVRSVIADLGDWMDSQG